METRMTHIFVNRDAPKCCLVTTQSKASQQANWLLSIKRHRFTYWIPMETSNAPSNFPYSGFTCFTISLRKEWGCWRQSLWWQEFMVQKEMTGRLRVTTTSSQTSVPEIFGGGSCCLMGPTKHRILQSTLPKGSRGFSIQHNSSN